MTQLQHIAGEVSLSCSSLLPVALLLYPELVHGNLDFNSLAKAAMAFLLALRWRELTSAQS
jgi:hypothetical protein